jgi:hypothetical protein
MNIKQSTLAVAVTAALSMGVSGQAAADVYAGSVTNLTNFVIEIDPFAGAEITGFNFTTVNTAQLNNGTVATTDDTCGGLPTGSLTGNDCGPSGAVLDASAANSADNDATGDRAENSFTLQGIAVSGNWSGSDSLVAEAELVTFAPSETSTLAEAKLESGTQASATSEIQSNTQFLFTFTLEDLGSLDLSFDADTFLVAQITADELGTPHSAQANNKMSVTLTQSTCPDDEPGL